MLDGLVLSVSEAFAENPVLEIAREDLRSGTAAATVIGCGELFFVYAEFISGDKGTRSGVILARK
jgi:hypothetical protein